MLHFNLRPLQDDKSDCGSLLSHSSSTLNWPICRYSSPSSLSRAFSCWARRWEKSSGSSSSSRALHWRIWLEGMPYFEAIWAIVFSPLTACRATLTLKAASRILFILPIVIHTSSTMIWRAKCTYTSCPVFGDGSILYQTYLVDLNQYVFG